MTEFWNGIKIRKVALLYLLISCGIYIISRLSYFQEKIVLDFWFWNIITNFILLIYFGFKILKSNIQLKVLMNDFKLKVKWNEIIKVVCINIALGTGFIFSLFFLLYKINIELFNELLYTPSVEEKETIITLIFFTIGSTFLAPFVEEFIFRGVILNRLSKLWGIKVSIVLSSCIFGLFHARLSFFNMFIFGMMMTLLYIRTENLLIPISAHFLNNLLVSSFKFVMFFMNNSPSNEEIDNSDIYVLGSLGLIILVMSSFFLFKFISENWPNQKNLEESNIK